MPSTACGIFALLIVLGALLAGTLIIVGLLIIACGVAIAFGVISGPSAVMVVVIGVVVVVLGLVVVACCIGLMALSNANGC